MTQEDKELLLIDISARLPYGVMVYDYDKEETREMGLGTLHDIMFNELECKPYLRPMSSMTEDERFEFNNLWNDGFSKAMDEMIINDDNDIGVSSLEVTAASNALNWLNKYHFDYRGLIPKGLAIAVTKENNFYKNLNYVEE